MISDLRAIFPPAPGRFLIGPMLKLGWGRPTFVQLDLGRDHREPRQLCDRRRARGSSSATMRASRSSGCSPISSARSSSTRAAAGSSPSLFDSRLIAITIDGEMGVLVARGPDKNLLISNGGFHPQFEPPALPFPVPKRLAFNIIDSEKARIRIEGYLAVTSNTVQFGARADLHLGFSSFSIDGHLQFDVLVRQQAVLPHRRRPGARRPQGRRRRRLQHRHRLHALGARAVARPGSRLDQPAVRHHPQELR